MSKLNLVEDEIATINIITKNELSSIQTKLIQSLAYLQMMCITAPDDEPEKIGEFITILTETIDKSTKLWESGEDHIDVTAQF